MAGAALAWTGLTLVRGALDGWYPYPFLDPVNGGYGTVALYSLGILGLLVLTIWLAATIGSALRARRRD